LNECGHPKPDEAGLRGASRIAKIAEQAGERDLVICVMSGGGSALLPAPADGVTLEEKQAITKLLLDCGANIHEINAVRKHISGIKGGQLARLAAPAAVEGLLLSDVIGDNLDVIGSGPTAPDASTFATAAGTYTANRIIVLEPRSTGRLSMQVMSPKGQVQYSGEAEIAKGRLVGKMTVSLPGIPVEVRIEGDLSRSGDIRIAKPGVRLRVRSRAPEAGGEQER
jgi:glycerate-2-kinase